VEVPPFNPIPNSMYLISPPPTSIYQAMILLSPPLIAMIVYVLMTMYLSLSQANPCTLDAH
jgi:hypothetical protein